MSPVKRQGLKIDDPLAPGGGSAVDEPARDARVAAPAPVATQAAGAAPKQAAGSGPKRAAGSAPKRAAGSAPAQAAGAAPRRGGTKPGARRKPANGGNGRSKAAPQPGAVADGLWRDWSGVTGVGSFRLPHELLTELSDTARELGLPVGLMATAAIAQLLDLPSDQIADLVYRADDARIHGRRTSRRPLTKE